MINAKNSIKTESKTQNQTSLFPKRQYYYHQQSIQNNNNNNNTSPPISISISSPHHHTIITPSSHHHHHHRVSPLAVCARSASIDDFLSEKPQWHAPWKLMRVWTTQHVDGIYKDRKRTLVKRLIDYSSNSFHLSQQTNQPTTN